LTLAVTSAMAGVDSKDLRRRAHEELQSSLEQLSVKSIIEFRGQIEVSSAVEQVAAAAVCTIANIDDTVEAADDALPDTSWAGAQAAMAKPGHFINALRRFPYAVDSGRMPDVNIGAAQQCLEGLDVAGLADMPVAQHLLQWVKAAESYWAVQQELKDASVEAPAAAELDTSGRSAKPQGAADRLSSAGFTLETSLPDSVTTSQGFVVEAAAQEAPPRPPRAVPAPTPAAPQATREFTGSRAAPGSKTAPVPDSPSTRRVSAPSGGVAGPRPQVPASRVTRVPARRPSGTLAKSGMPPRQVTDMSIEDWKRKLEQVKRETREMKSMEQGAKWQMKREEDIKKKEDYKAATEEITDWRKSASNGMRDYIKDVKLGAKQMELGESRDFQDFKRDHKIEEKQIDQMNIKECYEDVKENSEWEAQLQKDRPPEERRLIIEENLEKYHLVAEYNAAEKAFEDAEDLDSKALDRQLRMNLELDRARQQQELSAQSLEYAREMHQRSAAGADRVELQPCMVTGLDPQQ